VSIANFDSFSIPSALPSDVYSIKRPVVSFEFHIASSANLKSHLLSARLDNCFHLWSDSVSLWAISVANSSSPSCMAKSNL